MSLDNPSFPCFHTFVHLQDLKKNSNRIENDLIVSSAQVSSILSTIMDHHVSITDVVAHDFECLNCPEQGHMMSWEYLLIRYSQ